MSENSYFLLFLFIFFAALFKSLVLSKQQSKIYFKLTLIQNHDNQLIFTVEMLQPVRSGCLMLVKLQVRLRLHTFLTFNQIRLNHL